MTYSKKYGNYGIYTDGMLYRWFKNLDNAIAYWNEMMHNSEAVEEWLEEFDSVKLINMRTGEVIENI